MTFPPASVDRLLHIAAFAVSGYSGTAGRTTKPFNPLLGETFEFVCQEKVRWSPTQGQVLPQALAATEGALIAWFAPCRECVHRA
jgi:Oxysterol-binding protein